MKTIGIKLADGSFYPVLEEGRPSEKQLDLTTAHNNQTKIMVDLYRSSNCSMDDAEYVDSLQIENLKEHPNGEPNLSFTVSIDENNELSARIVDPETGKQSNTTITLVSRTVQERLVTDEYNISDTIIGDSFEEEKTPAKKVTGAGLLAIADAINKKQEKESPDLDIPEVTEEAPVETEETAVSEEEVTEIFDDVELPESTESAEPTESFELTESFEPAETTELSAPFEDIEQGDLSEDKYELKSEEPDFIEDEHIDVEPFADPVVITETQDTVEEVQDTTEEAFNTQEIGDFDFNLDDNTLPDLDLNFNEDNNITEEETITQEIAPEDDYSLPDFDDIPETTETSLNDSDFNLDDDLFADMPADDPAPVSSGISFTGLYDTNELETDEELEEDDVKKKTKVPVIICIVCAIICIIATLLILFIIPSKYNLLSKKTAKESVPVEEVVETPVVEPEPIPEPEPEPIPEPEPEPEPVPEAVEDEIIVIEKAEEVVPLPPPVVEEVKPKNITYKIRWGDTLWDIANTYYKNPWRYKYIARYNGIKDPDYIISGTYIIIPAE